MNKLILFLVSISSIIILKFVSKNENIEFLNENILSYIYNNQNKTIN